MKAIILAAGKGTRLYPMTKPVSKPLIPVYDKPLIYYPLCTLLEAGIRDILVIVPPDHTAQFQALLGDGSGLGVQISYLEQKVQRGIADAFLVAEDWIGGEPVCLILGDNIFFGPHFRLSFARALELERGAAVFGYRVEDPRPFGVVEFDADGFAVSIEEKPAEPKSNYIIPGVYVYDGTVSAIAHALRPSPRGELEITDVNRAYLARGELTVFTLDETTSWLDAGNPDAVLDAGLTVRDLERETGFPIGCIERAALEQGFVTREQVHAAGRAMPGTRYGAYLCSL